MVINIKVKLMVTNVAIYQNPSSLLMPIFAVHVYHNIRHTKEYIFVTLSQPSILYHISDVEWRIPTHYNYQICLFQKILDRLPAWTFIYEIFTRKRAKNTIQLCIDWCLIDRFQTGLVRVRAWNTKNNPHNILERALYGNYNAYLSFYIW